MRLFIWEGNGISDAYHNDGTLVVLAESPEQARVLVRTARAERDSAYAEWERRRDEYMSTFDTSAARAAWTKTDEGKAIWDSCPRWERELWDGRDSALDREPDRVVEIDQPTWVAFNGGGYD